MKTLHSTLFLGQLNQKCTYPYEDKWQEMWKSYFKQIAIRVENKSTDANKVLRLNDSGVFNREETLEAVENCFLKNQHY